jgi:plastocyanin domain-containing protein
VKDAFNHTAKAEETFIVGQPIPLLIIVTVVGTAIIAIVSTVILLYKKSKNKATPKPKSDENYGT